ncbi:isoprenylcysteine carboxylmethyltransferase family protein [Streptomyces sp. ICBB 8177]|uniref:methyltransferase family protein n=1 Tax=Streptomyces sp. ICBB 8177 TaxID=563922 RepID=UPI001F53F792|nr:isoprenylcysteine carboxylmethyltransferase family protein [Streptomyces sp. ICBB 8177]
MEWPSLLLFVVMIGGGSRLAGPVAHAVPGLSYPTGSAGVRLVVLLVAWAGIVLRLWAIVALGRFFRGTVHIQDDHQVVRSGPYRWVRHPAYSGMLLGGLTLALMSGNVAAWLLLVACALVALGYRIRVEERMLTESLGEAYTSYAATTARLIPRVW